MKFYLAGPIGFTKGLEHKTWRDEITKFLKSRGHEALDPLHKLVLVPVGDAREYLNKLRDERKLDESRGFVRRYIIPSDLAMVDQSDIVLAYVPRGVRMCGTWGEITWGYGHGKAVFIVTNLPKNLLPNWMIGCSTFIFRNFKEFRRFMGEKEG